jgi:hypothetical protein
MSEKAFDLHEFLGRVPPAKRAALHMKLIDAYEVWVKIETTGCRKCPLSNSCVTGRLIGKHLEQVKTPPLALLRAAKSCTQTEL